MARPKWPVLPLLPAIFRPLDTQVIQQALLRDVVEKLTESSARKNLERSMEEFNPINIGRRASRGTNARIAEATLS